MTNFEGVWLDIRRKLKVGTELKGWSHDRGYTTTRFNIIDVSPASVTISSSTVSQPRAVSKGDVAKVYEVWADYCAGKVSRVEMVKLSQNTTYIFGILKWLEDEAKGNSKPALR